MTRLFYLFTLTTCTSVFNKGADAQSDGSSRDACSVYAVTKTLEMSPGQYKARRRVVYDTTKQILPDQYDSTMYDLGLKWGNGKKSTPCQ